MPGWPLRPARRNREWGPGHRILAAAPGVAGTGTAFLAGGATQLAAGRGADRGLDPALTTPCDG